MSALRDAMVEAGIRSPRMRLEEMATESLERARGDWTEAMRLFTDALVNGADLDLLHEAIRNHRIEIAREFLTEAKRRAWQQAQKIGGGQRNPADQKHFAAPEPHASGRMVGENPILSAARTPRAEGQQVREGHSGVALRAPSRDVAGAAEMVRRLSIASTFKVQGVALRDATVEMARGLAGSRRRDARFLDYVTENLPPGARIGDYRQDDEIDALYERAKAEANAE